MKFTAAGDAIIQRRIQNDFEGYEELRPFIMQGDARFFNLETTLNYEGECPASQFSGGTYIRTVPEVLDDLKLFGFNMATANNNHALDFSYEGLERTRTSLDESGLVHAGIGRNLAEASAPRYLDTKNGRVALIAVNTSFHPPMMAGKQTERVKGRAGINGLRISKKLTVNREELEFIKKLAERTHVNLETEIDRRDGYFTDLPDGEAEFGNIKLVLGEKTGRVLTPSEEDMKRIERSIFEAKLQADYVMISLHNHQLDGEEKEDVPAFLSEVAHRFIDKGADAIVGHGPHLLRAIEVYKNKSIFYSLGDFILELYSIDFAPDDFFAQHGLDANSDTVHALLEKRSKGFKIGLMEDKKMLETIIPLWETDEKGDLVSLKFMPVELGRKCKKSDEGLPRQAKDLGLVERLAEISKPYGVEMTVEDDGTVTCKW
ncbi:MAG: CapA family protein [Clostridia bacterium]|nr:CapA family protein [Clostridia bacterium]